VGLKPTVGLVSRTFVVPISHSQDTPGPMTRTVADAALMLTAMAGSDPKDAATAQADLHSTNYLAALQGATLKGKRLGVLRYATGLSEDDDRLFEATLEKLRAAGAEIVEIRDFRPDPAMGVGENQVLMSELKADLNAYLATTPAAVTSRTLADLIAFNAATPRELVLFGQDEFETAQRTQGLDDPLYQKARAQSLKAATEDGIDKLLETYKVDALVAPSYVPAWFSDVTGGARGGGRVSDLAAVAGYSNLTVPMGQIHGLPVGFAFIGPAWSEARLLALGAAFEAVVQGRKPPTYAASVESMPEVAKALAPPQPR
jgi:amidase